jgi:hypothetical protein
MEQRSQATVGSSRRSEPTTGSACACVRVRMGTTVLMATHGWSPPFDLEPTGSACVCVCVRMEPTFAEGDQYWSPCRRSDQLAGVCVRVRVRAYGEQLADCDGRLVSCCRSLLTPRVRACAVRQVWNGRRMATYRLACCAVDLDNIWRCACVCACVCMETGLRWRRLAGVLCAVDLEPHRQVCVRACACAYVRMGTGSQTWRRSGSVLSILGQPAGVRARAVRVYGTTTMATAGWLIVLSILAHRQVCVCSACMGTTGRSDGRLASVLSIFATGRCVRAVRRRTNGSQMAMYWSFHCAVDLGHTAVCVCVRSENRRQSAMVVASSRRSLELTLAGVRARACVRGTTVADSDHVWPPCRRSRSSHRQAACVRVCACVAGNNGRSWRRSSVIRAVDPYQLAVCVRVCVCACMGNGRRWRSSLASVCHLEPQLAGVRACACVRVCEHGNGSQKAMVNIHQAVDLVSTPAGVCVCVHGNGSQMVIGRSFCAADLGAHTGRCVRVRALFRFQAWERLR